MKIFVINLARRTDRLKHISGQLNGYDFVPVEAIDGNTLSLSGSQHKYYKDWVDPLLNRRLTIGEIATTLSHIKVWNMVAELDEPALILEDDSILSGDFRPADILGYMERCDMLYLNHREMVESNAREINDELVRPYYPYLGNAYVITPKFARDLIALGLHQCIIPVDEFFPIINGVDFNHYCLSESSNIKKCFVDLSKKFSRETYKIYAYKTPIFEQQSRSVMGSDIENSPTIPDDYYFLTVGTDESQMDALYASCKRHNVNIINLGKGKTWTGGNMEAGPGGGYKLNLVKTFLESSNLPDNTIIGFFDGYDVLINDTEQTIIDKFKSFEASIVFAAEKTCWPDSSIASQYPPCDTEYRYLNSGCYIGYAGSLKQIIWSVDPYGDVVGDTSDDQLYLHLKYLENYEVPGVRIRLDHRNELFQCLSGAEDSLGFTSSDNIFNTETKTCPSILHGNGGKFQKEVFRKIYVDKFLPDLMQFNSASKFSIVAPEILLTDFFTKRDCEYIIQKAELINQWEQLPGDKFPGQELRIKKLDQGLYNLMEEKIRTGLYPAIEQYWRPLQMYGIRDMFIIKYQHGSQISLPCHHDASLVTITVRLNDEYEGAELYFYRQNYSNIDVKTGEAIIWPGQVTHGHESRPLISGIKYSLVIWTSRYKGDVN